MRDAGESESESRRVQVRVRVRVRIRVRVHVRVRVRVLALTSACGPGPDWRAVSRDSSWRQTRWLLRCRLSGKLLSLRGVRVLVRVRVRVASAPGSLTEKVAAPRRIFFRPVSTDCNPPIVLGRGRILRKF